MRPLRAGTKLGAQEAINARRPALALGDEIESREAEHGRAR